jgi:hypothetical protein
LETHVLRRIEKDPKLRLDTGYTFDAIIEALNRLLDNVQVVRSEDGGFKIRNRNNHQWQETASLSSGESELISLGIEVLSYAYSSEYDRDNWFLSMSQTFLFIQIYKIG